MTRGGTPTGPGSRLERIVFGHRTAVALACLAVTLALGVSALDVRLNAAFSSRIPLGHPFIQNFLRHEDDLKGRGNALKIVVATTGSILDAAYLETLQHLNDAVFLLPGVDRPFMQSLWTPSTRWRAVTEQGFDGGPVMPDHFDGSDAARAEVRSNILHAGLLGQLVAADFRSSLILVPLLDRDAETRAPLDYGRLSRSLEDLRSQYGSGTISIRIVGPAKVAGDMINGLRQILLYFAASVVIAAGAVLWFTGCLRSTLLVMACSLTAVIWQVGLLPILGFDLDPYSILVPFLVFAIGMSHGAQKMNSVMQDVGRGLHRLDAARMTFRRLFVAGLTALICDAAGFAVLLLIPIEAIQRLALISCLGVAVLVVTNLILLPVLLSHFGVNAVAAARAVAADGEAGTAADARLWRWLGAFTQPLPAALTILAFLVIASGSWVIGSRLRVGDLDPGAPELRASSRYNRDNAFLNAHYGATSDQLIVMVTSAPGRCGDYATLAQIDQLEWELLAVPGVDGTSSGADLARRMLPALNDGNLRWTEVIPNAGTLHYVIPNAPRGLFGQNCDLTPVTVSLHDHEADTLERVVAHVRAFAAAHDGDGIAFELAAGNGGIEAATNDVVARASGRMLLYVYLAVAAFSWVTFRSWRGVVAALIPLAVTSLAAQALMVALGIGLKVATLPVTALGVGIGVDYALYTLSVTLAGMRAGASLSCAYGDALRLTGRVVMLTGFTLAAAVMTWAMSPIKFQADMGILLSFMFLFNMLGALTLLPALACFLLPGDASALAGRHRASATPPEADRIVGRVGAKPMPFDVRDREATQAPARGNP